MNIINFILSFYIVIISGLPCADLEIYSASHTATVSVSTVDNHNHDKEKDLCPPFCACNCCGAQVFGYSPQVVLEFPLNSVVTSHKTIYYTSVFTSNFFGSIWQPPQIV